MNAELLRKLSQFHHPAPPASEREIREFEAHAGWQLDADLRAFYLYSNGARLFREEDAPYWILPLDRIIRARVAIYGRDEDQWGPASWYVVCDVGDTNFVSIDHQQGFNGNYPLFDCFHETFYIPKQRPMVARSFSEFLDRAMSSNGNLFWLSSNPS